MLDALVGDGVRTIIVESPDRFARDLTVQLAGHDYLRGLGLDLVPTSAPDFFLNDTPTAVLVRQVLGAISQFEKATLVAKLKAARDPKRQRTGKVEGRKGCSETHAALVAEARDMRPPGPEVAADRRRAGGTPLRQRQGQCLCAGSDRPHVRATIKRQIARLILPGVVRPGAEAVASTPPLRLLDAIW
jgi:DNA invertase Pin-like site-specific DNA recombinase